MLWADILIFINALRMIFSIHDLKWLLIEDAIVSIYYSASKAEFVTCGTILKLLNTDLRLRLHSHDVKYGSGSGQQSVTAVDVTDDHNSHWLVRAPTEETCKRG